ncbi:phage protein [Ruminococcus sp.]|uniref:phage structural protein n=1 Tax=Ruminococcus sp. TaxID=41978 RepID=UPI00261388E4|nr:phage protein [Ruminococcus sp.]MDD6988773.1 DUF3277 family protein [Ruminococcus sp.]
MANITRYNAKDCTIMVNNVYITGLGEDMVSGEKDEDFFEPSVGAQGDIVACEVNNTLGTVTITVQPTSPQKSFLMGLAGVAEFVPLWVVNKGLNERFGGTKAKLKKYPEMSRNATAEDMEFEFQVFDYVVEATE